MMNEQAESHEHLNDVVVNQTEGAEDTGDLYDHNEYAAESYEEAGEEGSSQDQFASKFAALSRKEKALRDWPEEFVADNDPYIDKEPNPTEWDGFIAQDVKEAADKLGVEYSGWTEDSANTRQELDYARFVVPLVKAVQELSQQVEDLKAKVGE